MSADVATEVLAVHAWPSNAHLIEDVARLGYLRSEWSTLDPTYGLGVFWQRWRPDELTGSDIDPAKSPLGAAMDFTGLWWPSESFAAVVFDPPYKLNGTPDPTPDGVDHRFGVHEATSWQDRMALIVDGVRECARVSSRMLLVKCQDQVVSGKVVWQTDAVTHVAAESGFRKVDRFDMLGTSRPQPPGRRQVHARRRPSTLLVFERGTSQEQRVQMRRERAS